jgi:hypothetical protein
MNNILDIRTVLQLLELNGYPLYIYSSVFCVKYKLFSKCLADRNCQIELKLLVRI